MYYEIFRAINSELRKYPEESKFAAEYLTKTISELCCKRYCITKVGKYYRVCVYSHTGILDAVTLKEIKKVEE